MENVLAMKGGLGDSSYAHNSAVQINMVEAVKPILEQGIFDYMRRQQLTGGGGAFRVADLGCATGKNTLVAADTIVRAVQSMYRSMQKEVPEIEVYFTDLPSNDFNSLFKMLPPHKQLADADADADEDDKKPLATRSYFAAAVCGSYFRRLFPQFSLHFCHSSISLHWLSRVPQSVENKSSLAWSGSRVYISSECKEEVGSAYLNQFEKDMIAFLRARSKEIVVGGGMFIALIGRKSGTHIMKEQGVLGDMARHMEYAFEELFNEGLIEKEKWESFNIPWFGPNPEELRSIVEKEGSFGIESDVKVMGGFPSFPMTNVRKGEEQMFGRAVGNHYRALFENIMQAHLGSVDLTNEFFSKIAKRASTKFPEYLLNQIELIVALLIHKGG